MHFSVIQNEGYKALTEAQEVEFDVEQGPKGEQAKNLKRVYPDIEIELNCYKFA